jgi:quinol monooxygenase YgiN
MLARVAHCTAKPGQAGEVARLLRQVSEILAGFDGCEQYLVCRRPDTDEVWVLERWRDRERMQAALQLPEFREMIPRVQELVAAWASPVDLEPVEP